MTRNDEYGDSIEGRDPGDMPDPMSPDPEVDALERAWIEVESEDEAKGVVGRGRFIDRLLEALHAAGYRVVADETLPVVTYPKGYDHRRGCSRRHPVTFPCDKGTLTEAARRYLASASTEEERQHDQ